MTDDDHIDAALARLRDGLRRDGAELRSAYYRWVARERYALALQLDIERDQRRKKKDLARRAARSSSSQLNSSNPRVNVTHRRNHHA